MAEQNSERSKAIQIAEALCVKFEGVYLKPYLCPAGKWTIGVGATFYEDGRLVLPSDPAITQEQAFALLRQQLERHFLPGVLRQCPILAFEKPERLAAVLDFSFNLGVGRLQTSTLRRKINAKDWAGAKEQLMLWVRGGGKVLPGLVKRRAAECALLE